MSLAPFAFVGPAWDAPRDAEGMELVATPDEVRAMDRLAIEGWGLPGRQLMELAGASAARLIRERVGGLPGKAVVLCGLGNNGGDGWVVARYLHAAGWIVRAVALGEPKPGSDAHANFALWQRLGGEIRLAERGATARMKNWLNHANVVVDGLFGTGLGRPLEGAARELVEAANEASHGLKVALDLPSGLDGERGAVLGAAFRADLTVTFGVAKAGLYLGEGPAHAGEIAVVDIGWPRPVVAEVGASLRRATEQGLAPLVPPRPADGHKGSFGHVGVVGGAEGMGGAAILAARGAMRAGAGLVTWITPPSGAGDGAPVERFPELMQATLTDGESLPVRPTVLVVGPGLGRSDGARAALDLALRDPRPAVFDADALNLLAEGGRLAELHGGPPRVLTPHPLEAARLLGVAASEVQGDRVAAASRLAALSGAVVVLKGARSLVAAPGAAPILVDLADATLAVGGSGDVLAGICAGLLAQGASPIAAALVATFAHAVAGREAGLDQGQRGALASEIADHVPMALTTLATSL